MKVKITKPDSTEVWVAEEPQTFVIEGEEQHLSGQALLDHRREIGKLPFYADDAVYEIVGDAFELPFVDPLTPISPLQLRMALLGRELLARIPDVLASITDETQRLKAETAWEYATSYDPDSPLTLELAGLFVMHPAVTIDTMDEFWELWREAMAVRV